MANTQVKAPVGTYLTRDTLHRYAPSVFATEAHESRSDRYTYIPTIDIVERMVKEGFAPVQAGQSICRKADKTPFTKHLIRFRHRNDIAKAAAVGETVNEIVLVNSHDGTSSYQLTAGVFRFVCSNGMVVPTSVSDAIRIPHKGDILDNVIEGSYRILDDAEGISRSIDTMRRVHLLPAEQTAFANAALAMRYEADDNGNPIAPITSTTALLARRAEDRQDDVWHTFNRLQENLIKGGLRGRLANGNRTHTREITSIDTDLGLNKALWALADAIATAKA